MNQINTLDAVDCIDALNANLDQVEGILYALEITLSTSDSHHHKLPGAVTAAMSFVGESRGLIKTLSQAREREDMGLDDAI